MIMCDGLLEGCNGGWERVCRRERMEIREEKKSDEG